MERVVPKPKQWDTVTGHVPRDGNIFNIFKNYTSLNVKQIGVSTATVENEPRDPSIDNPPEPVLPCYFPPSKKRRWRSPKRYVEDCSGEENKVLKEQNIVNPNSDYDQSFESDSSLLDCMEDMSFSCDSDSSSSLSPSSSPRNASYTSAPAIHITSRNVISNIPQKSKIQSEDKSHRPKKQDKVKPKPGQLNRSTKDVCEKTERRLNKTAPIDRKRKSKTSSHKKIIVASCKNSGDIKMQKEVNDGEIRLHAPSHKKKEREKISHVVKEKASHISPNKDRNKKSKTIEEKKKKKDVFTQKRLNDGKSHGVPGTISSEKTARNKSSVNNSVKDTEKVMNLIVQPSKQTHRSGQKLSTGDNNRRTKISRCDEKENHKSFKPEISAKKDHEKVKRLVANNSKSAKKENISKQSKSVKKGGSSKQSRPNVNTLNVAVSAVSSKQLDCVQTTDAEKKVKKLNTSDTKGNKREKLKDSDKTSNRDKLRNESSKIKKGHEKEQVKKDLGKEQIKRDIAKEKGKQKHGKVPAAESDHKQPRKNLESVKTGNVSEQTAGVKNPEDKYQKKSKP